MYGGQVEKACEEEGEGQNDASGYQVTRWATRSRWKDAKVWRIAILQIP